MADRGWTRQTVAAAGVAAGAGAAQLGIGYGLGIVVWPTTVTTGDTIWLSGLAWAVWIAAGSTVLGAVAGLRLRPGTPTRPGALVRLTLVMAAAVGATLTVALIALPARAAVRPDTFSPQSIAAGYATLGILLGLVIAWWAAASRPVAANVLATSGWLWTLAVVAIGSGLRADLPATGVQLGHWRMTDLGSRFYYGTVYWPAALLAITAALLIGALAAWPAVRRGDRGLGAAASGAVGPLLVAAAYFTLAPQLTGGRGLLESAYLIAPYAVLAGLAGSATVVTLGSQAASRRAARRYARSREAARSDSSGRPVPAGDQPAGGWFDPNSTDNIVAADWSVRAEPGGPPSDPDASVDQPDTRPSPATGRAKLPTPRTEVPPPVPSGPRARSTVKPPPANPTVAAIKPPLRPSAGPPARPDPDSRPGSGTRPGSPSAVPDPTTPESTAPAASTPRASSSGASSSGASSSRASSSGATSSRAPSSGAGVTAAGAPKKAASPAKSAPRSGRGDDDAPAKGQAARSSSGRSGARSPGAPARKAARAATPTSAAAPADPPPADLAPGAPEPGRTGPDEKAAADASHNGTAARRDDSAAMPTVTAAPRDSAPLWVDDAEGRSDPEPDTERDGLKNRLRRFGRRPGSNTTFDPDSEPPA